MAMNIIEQLEKEQAASLAKKRKVPEFGPGDTVRVNVKVIEGDRARVQAYEGVCIGRAGGALDGRVRQGSAITVMLKLPDTSMRPIARRPRAGGEGARSKDAPEMEGGEGEGGGDSPRRMPRSPGWIDGAAARMRLSAAAALVPLCTPIAMTRRGPFGVMPAQTPRTTWGTSETIGDAAGSTGRTPPGSGSGA